MPPKFSPSTITLRFKIEDITLVLSIELKSSIAEVALTVAKALSRSIPEDDPLDLSSIKADQLALWSTSEDTIEDPAAVSWTRLRTEDKVDKVLSNAAIVGVSRIVDGKAPRPHLVVYTEASMTN